MVQVVLLLHLLHLPDKQVDDLLHLHARLLHGLDQLKQLGYLGRVHALGLLVQGAETTRLGVNVGCQGLSQVIATSTSSRMI